MYFHPTNWNNMYKQFKVTNKPGYGCMKAPKTMTIRRPVPTVDAFELELKDLSNDSGCREARIYFDDKDRDDLYGRVNWIMLMNNKEVEFQQHQWNHVALRALLLVLSATHKSDFSQYTLDLETDVSRFAPLDGEPLPPYTPTLTDAPKRKQRRLRSPKRSATSSTSSAPSAASGSRTCGELQPRVLFRTSRLSEEPQPCELRGSIRWGSRTHPHQVVDGDYLCDGIRHGLLTTPQIAQRWGWELEDVKNDECLYKHSTPVPEHTLEDDNGLPLEPLWPITPMSEGEPVTPIYVEE